MNASELAWTMLSWEAQSIMLDELERRIKEAVLELGKYDYAGALGAVDCGSLVPFEQVVVNYKAACKHWGVKDIPFTESEPSVTVKLLE